MEIGDVVWFIDPVGERHYALVTNVFGNTDAPSLNLVYVSPDTEATDQYGRQLATRVTSCVHASNQYAHGNKWQELDPPAGG